MFKFDFVTEGNEDETQVAEVAEQTVLEVEARQHLLSDLVSSISINSPREPLDLRR